MFEISQFESYREDNRREVKRQRAVSLMPYGIRIQHLRIVMEELLFLAFVKMKMGAGIQQD